jgi:hypothetical protein
MIFNGIDNQLVEFRIINYQYPDIKSGDWDDDWLIIYLNVKSKVGHWQAIDPSMTTWEIKELINWFADLSNNKKLKYKRLDFTEPNLSFEHIGFNRNKFLIRLRFELESRPQSAVDDKEYFVDFEYNSNEIKQIIIDLTNELNNFPERKGKE